MRKIKEWLLQRYFIVNVVLVILLIIRSFMFKTITTFTIISILLLIFSTIIIKRDNDRDKK